MKKVTSAALIAMVLTFSIAFSSSSAWAQCGTKGSAALAFAQLFGFEVTDVDAAITALATIGLAPELWEPVDACVDAAFVDTVQDALIAAVDTGLLGGDEIVGAMETVLESIGEAELIAQLEGLPNTFDPTNLPEKGWLPLEGVPEDQQVVEGEITIRRTTRRTTDATPVVP